MNLSVLLAVAFVTDCYRCSRTVLAGGTFPGPLIQAQRVRKPFEFIHFTPGLPTLHFQNGRFQINVRDELTDSRMIRSTSIVRYYPSQMSVQSASLIFSSTGMGYYKRLPIGLMGRLLSPSALLRPIILSCMTSELQTRRGPSGITHIYVRDFLSYLWLSSD